MLRKFKEINTSLSEQQMDEANQHFNKFLKTKRVREIPLNKLPHILQKMRIKIPEPMMKQYIKCLQETPQIMINFEQLTHYIARASLQTQIQEQLYTLFQAIDQTEEGAITSEDLFNFIHALEGGNQMNQPDVDTLMRYMDYKDMGFLTFQDFLYAMLPR